MSERYFNRHDAEELLPMIEFHLEQARTHKRELDAINLEFSQAAARIMVLGGSVPPFAALAGKKTERDRAISEVSEAINKIQETGCVVKDLDEGLVDFPSRIGGQEVYLCWKLGEERVSFWHGMDEGFAGRKPLESEDDEEPPRLH